MLFSALYLLHAAQSFPIGLIRPMTYLQLGQKANKYQLNVPSEKAARSAKPACKFELSSTESVKTGFTVRHKPAAPTTARPSRNGLTVMFYISKSI